MICKNCEHNFNGNFCTNCGQNSGVRKVDLNYLLDEIPNSILQVNRGLLFTIKQLFIKPGYSIREFLEGKRKLYYKPIAFLLFTSTLYVLFAFLFDINTFIDDLITGIKESMQDTNQTSGLDTLNWISKNQTYIILLFLPFYSLASYVAFIKSKYNYFEHLVLNIYITGQQMIIYLVLSFIFLKENLLLSIPYIIGIIFNFWTFNQFFKDKKSLNTIWLTVLTYIIFIIVISLFMVVSTLILVVLKK